MRINAILEWVQNCTGGMFTLGGVAFHKVEVSMVILRWLYVFC